LPGTAGHLDRLDKAEVTGSSPVSPIAGGPLGLPNIEFVEDDEMTAHDDALVPALVSGEGSIEPFTRLLAELIERSTAPDT